MTARAYLMQARELYKSLKVLSQEIERRRTIAEKTVGQLQHDRIQTSKTGKEGEDNLIEIATMSTELSYRQKVLNDLMTEISLNITAYSFKHCDVLYDYYIRRMTLDEIAQKYHKSRQWSWSERNAGETDIMKAMIKYPSDFSEVALPNNDKT